MNFTLTTLISSGCVAVLYHYGGWPAVIAGAVWVFCGAFPLLVKK